MRADSHTLSCCSATATADISPIEVGRDQPCQTPGRPLCVWARVALYEGWQYPLCRFQYQFMSLAAPLKLLAAPRRETVKPCDTTKDTSVLNLERESTRVSRLSIRKLCELALSANKGTNATHGGVRSQCSSPVQTCAALNTSAVLLRLAICDFVLLFLYYLLSDRRVVCRSGVR